MRRATITLSEEIAQALEAYLKAQEVPPSRTAVIQAALREYLSRRGYLPEPLSTESVEKSGQKSPRGRMVPKV
ncbi:MAG: hypothetical protein N3A55_10760 [Methylohalobius sp.]|nr:hypothetical protein [Methylohalobius sp.]